MDDSQPGQFFHRQRVEFSDTDLAGVVHFSQFFRYAERAEHAYFRSLGLSALNVSEPPASRHLWPRVGAECEYRAPLIFEEEFTVELLVEEVRTSLLRYRCFFTKENGALAATAKISVVCARSSGEGGGLRAAELPAEFREKIIPVSAEILRKKLGGQG